MSRDISPEARFWASAKREGECLIWQKSCRRNGYGQVNYRGRNRSAHTLAYELARGELTPGMDVDHVCRRRACIEPTHLRLTTRKQNCENRETHPATSSGVRGVCWDKTRKRWRAALTHNYRTINLGRFDNLADAAAAVAAARATYFTHAAESR